jgi:hypothetical protein
VLVRGEGDVCEVCIIRTRTKPKSCRVFPSKTSFTWAGFTGRGVITSVSCTPLGTVSIMRAYKSAHVEAKRSGELANLRAVNEIFCGRMQCRTHERMVALLSLPKMRLSELVVALNPTTSGFFVVPEMYSVALHSG